MSCGYHEPHTKNEYISLREMDNAIAFAQAIIQNLGDQVYEHIYEYSWEADCQAFGSDLFMDVEEALMECGDDIELYDRLKIIIYNHTHINRMW
jgi:hypothetical protein